MLYMSGLPCGDGRECNVKEQEQTSLPAAENGHEHEPESCTPFCTCNCGAAASFIYLVNQQNTTSSAVEKVKFFSLPPFFESYHACSVWQPPRA